MNYPFKTEHIRFQKSQISFKREEITSVTITPKCTDDTGMDKSYSLREKFYQKVSKIWKRYQHSAISNALSASKLFYLKVHCATFYRPVNEQRHRALDAINSSLHELT